MPLKIYHPACLKRWRFALEDNASFGSVNITDGDADNWLGPCCCEEGASVQQQLVEKCFGSMETSPVASACIEHAEPASNQVQRAQRKRKQSHDADSEDESNPLCCFCGQALDTSRISCILCQRSAHERCAQQKEVSFLHDLFSKNSC